MQTHFTEGALKWQKHLIDETHTEKNNFHSTKMVLKHIVEDTLP